MDFPTLTKVTKNTIPYVLSLSNYDFAKLIIRLIVCGLAPCSQNCRILIDLTSSQFDKVTT